MADKLTSADAVCALLRTYQQVQAVATPVVPEGSCIKWVVESDNGAHSTFPKETKEDAYTMALNFPKGTVCHLYALACRPATSGDIDAMLDKMKKKDAVKKQIDTSVLEFTV